MRPSISTSPAGAQLGVTRADGGALPASGAASLYLPAGANGPAFLITDNFEVIRQYNTSDAYAMSVALLAERIAGRDIPIAPWPKVAPLSTADVKAMQQLLTERGFYRGDVRRQARPREPQRHPRLSIERRHTARRRLCDERSSGAAARPLKTLAIQMSRSR